MKHDIETALKMLDARGGDLDKEAARIIRKLRDPGSGGGGGAPEKRGLSRQDISEMLYAAKLAGARAELDATKRRLAAVEREHRILKGGMEATLTEVHGELTTAHNKIKHLRLIKEDYERMMQEYRDRIAKLMDRQHGLMNAVVDAQHERGAFAPDHPSRQLQPDVSRETSRDDLDNLKLEEGPLTVEKIESWHDLVQRKIAEKKAEHALAQALGRAGVKVEE